MWLYLLTILVLEAITVTAQQAVPSNASLPAGLANPAELLFSLSQGSDGYGPPYGIDYAQDANRGKWQDFHTTMQTNQSIFLTTPFNIDSLTNNSIAYISCDPANYTLGNLSLQQTIQQATLKIAPTSYRFGAILLYSLTSTWCNFSTDGTYSYPNVFILPNTNQAHSIYETLAEGKPGDQIASIYTNDTLDANGTATGTGGDGNNDNNSNSGMMTPSTTVAMIILYSVTGIITLCFVVVIITGALRARRHPERYGLLNLPGNAHQRRARGLARAMLDTIPIVKFGEKEPLKLSPDLEHGTELHAVKTHSLDGGHSPDMDGQAPIKEAASTEANSPQDANEATTGLGIDSTDNGLACSVCTEDFIKGQDLRVLPCNHKFHPECIDPWLLNVSGTCPLCRIDLRPPEQREDSVTDTGNENGTIPQAANAVGSDAPPNRANRFSMFLNRRRMLQASPADRLRALRQVYHLRRGNTIPPVPAIPDIPRAENVSASTTPVEGTTTHSNRVTRLFGRRDGSLATPSPERSTPQQ